MRWAASASAGSTGQIGLEKICKKRPNDRIGLVVFAAQAYIASPMTLDHDYLLENIDRMENRHDQFRRHGHRRRFDTALNRLRELKSKSQIIVLMTDGGNNSGKIDPITATEAAQTLGVKIYTIGLGNREHRRADGFAGRNYCRMRTRLQKIAQMTGGEILPRGQFGKTQLTFTTRSTGWKKPRPWSTNTRNTRNCFRG